MSNDDITIYPEENDKPSGFETMEDYMAYISKNHGDKAAGIQHIIDKDDWTIMQRLYSHKQLISIAKDQRLLQVQRRFDLINTTEEIINSVIIKSFENRARSVLVNDLVEYNRKDVENVKKQIKLLQISLRKSANEFIKFYREEREKLKEIEDLKELFNDNLEQIELMREFYFKYDREELNNIHKKLTEIEKLVARK